MTTRADPLFIVGAQRSGTTALGYALSRAAADNGGLVTVNGKLFYYLKRWWPDDLSGRHLRADEIVHSLHRRRPLGPNSDAWLARIATELEASSQRIADSGDSADLWEEMRKVCRRSYGDVPLWGDKYNEYLLDLSFLHALFPRALWIFIIRDPREVVASMLAWRGDRPWNPPTAEACAAKWKEWNSRWFNFRSGILPNRRVELNYGGVSPADYDRLSNFVEMDIRPYWAHHPSTRWRTSEVPPVADTILGAWHDFLKVLARD